MLSESDQGSKKPSATILRWMKAAKAKQASSREIPKAIEEQETQSEESEELKQSPGVEEFISDIKEMVEKLCTASSQVKITLLEQISLHKDEIQFFEQNAETINNDETIHPYFMNKGYYDRCYFKGQCIDHPKYGQVPTGRSVGLYPEGEIWIHYHKVDHGPVGKSIRIRPDNFKIMTKSFAFYL